LPDSATAPIPWSILTVLALLTSHRRVADAPAARLDGVASNVVIAGTGWLEALEDVEVDGGADTVMQPAARINVATINSSTFPILSLLKPEDF
jgi:hypothetical protein